ncbi:MAG: TIGR00268 family protein [Deltaproteobacteria bacterium RIFCSPLOWO2_02_FULL_47_10]|nr:MAG: TIGR00268 family protein [Deltaproteobacteria bacterium RIFCSPLOWO2_02_FULL_47_10]
MDNTMLENLRAKLKSLESAVVAFSGGVDSAVLTYVAHDVLDGSMLAVTGSSPSVPSRDLEAAVKFCRRREIPHMIVETHEFDDKNYVANPENRCFYCKGDLFKCLGIVAVQKGFKYVVEGTNASEILGHRPGFEAARSNPNVVTPYVKLGITKDDVRALAHKLGLEVADKPSTACLSSRIPTGTRLDADILKRVDEAENFLLSLGVKQVRLRHHGDIARIEVDSGDMTLCVEKNPAIAEKIRSLGWKYAVLDLSGYRTGGGR